MTQPKEPTVPVLAVRPGVTRTLEVPTSVVAAGEEAVEAYVDRALAPARKE